MATVVTISDALAARALAARLADPDRLRSHLVLTADRRRNRPPATVTLLAAALGPDHEVDLVDARVTQDLATALPAGGDVWPGIARAYPADTSPVGTRYWIPSPGQDADALARDIITHLTQATSVHHEPAATEPGTLPLHLATAAQADALAARLLDPHRSRPVVLCSIPTTATAPYADTPQVLDAVGDLADVHTITTGDATRALARRLPRGLEAFGGACRVYPTGTAWLDSWDAAPLRFAYSPSDRDHITRTLIADTWRALPHTTATSTPADALPATGTVLGVIGGRGMVRLATGDTATIWPEAFGDDLDADQLLVKGMSVEGLWHRDSGRLDISQMRQDPARALSGYQPGSHVLVRAGQVTDDRTLPVDLLPGITGHVARDQVTTSTLPLGDLVSAGEILVARLLSNNPTWQLSLDVDDTAPLQPTPAILTGGPAWLTLPEALPIPDVPTSATPPGDADDIATADTQDQERDQVVDQLRREQDKAGRLRAQLAQARTRLRTLTQDHQRLASAHELLQRDTGRTADDGHLFSDPVDQFDFELRLAWARRIPAGQKTELPLRRYTLGPEFLSSIQACHADRAKVVDVAVEILTGLHVGLDGRDLHQLRTSEAGNAPAVVRGDGATCWRVAVQRSSPSARRLHYWQCPDGAIELSSVRVHDDMRP